MTNYNDPTLVEARQLYVAAPILLPMLERYALSAHQRLIQRFREGDTNNIAIVAEISVLERLRYEITTKLNILNEPEAKK